MAKIKTKGFSLAAAALAMFGARAEVPTFVGELTVTTNALTRCVEVAYELDREAIVTLDVLTNGVSIGGRYMRRQTGAVNRRVAAGPQTLQWLPDPEWDGADGLSLRVRAYATDNPPDCLVASLTTNIVRFYESVEALPGGISDRRYATDFLVMRKIPAKGVRCKIGTPTTEPLRGGDPREWLHVVEFTNDFYAAVFPVTQAQYRHVMSNSGGAFTSGADAPRRPVTRIPFSAVRGLKYSWPEDGHRVDENSFLGKLRARTGIRSLDLPTETRWEYAARATCGNSLYTGVDVTNGAASTNDVDEVAWTYYNTLTNETVNSTMPVGLKKPNAWDLYDTIGNCFEFCLDYATTDWKTLYGDAVAVDPPGPTTGYAQIVNTMRAMRSSSPWPDGKAMPNYRVGLRSFQLYQQDNQSNHDYRGFRVFCEASL